MVNTKTGALTFGQINPLSGLKAALGMRRSEVIAQITASGLKGRGGAGFPTGVKWNLCAAAKSDTKFVVCNADEGEPGTFKDRVILTECADLVFAGMTIAGYVVGTDKGILYMRGEYSYLRPLLEQKLKERHEAGLLGKDILGTKGFDFEIAIQMGAGAYVCGEETALIESLEGHRGEPRNRPPYPVDTGFLGHPTTVNNVETLAWACCIMAEGDEWFKSFGTEKSPGLKVFSVAGDCAMPGVYEFPFGITIAELLTEVGGEDAKAVQVGGASGHCIPAKDFGRKICFEDVSTGGAVTIFGKDRDMLKIVKNYTEFFCDESCGQCTPCREGCQALLRGLIAMEKGRCSVAQLRELRALGQTMRLASKCGLGQSAPNTFLSVSEHFSDEMLGRQSTNGKEE